MGLLPDQMYDLTIGEIFRYYRNYCVRQARDWEKFRFVAWYGSLPYRQNGDSSTPYDLMRLETDPSEEEIKRLEKREEDDARKLIEDYKKRGLI